MNTMIEELQLLPSRDIFEPRILEVLERALTRQHQGPYYPLDNDAIKLRLTELLRHNGYSSFEIENIGRLAGGASKEQFVCDLITEAGTEKLVLRIDPLESIVETCRLREAAIIRAMDGILPLAKVRFLDGDGSMLGQPGMVTDFVQGVTKPPADEKLRISGVGTTFTDAWREILSPQFLDCLTRIHCFDWRNAKLPEFGVPTEFATQAALWQVNWWSKVWRDHQLAAYPAVTFAEEWMRENLPECDDPVLVHGDFRTGNIMFDPVTGEITAVLDWELCHIGDHHEELGWMMQSLFLGRDDKGKPLVCNLMPRSELIRNYEFNTGRSVDASTLHFYEVLNAYKIAVMNLGAGAGIALRGNSHQGSLLSYLSSIGHVVVDDICRLIEEGPKQ